MATSIDKAKIGTEKKRAELSKKLAKKIEQSEDKITQLKAESAKLIKPVVNDVSEVIYQMIVPFDAASPKKTIPKTRIKKAS